MTTLKDYKEKVLKSFEEKFVKGHPPISNSHYDVIEADSWIEASVEDIASFLSLAIDNAVAEAFKAVEVKQTLCATNCVGCTVGNHALQEVEDRKKQYLV